MDIPNIYEHIIFISLLIAFFAFIRSLFFLHNAINRLVAVYLLLITLFVASCYLSMLAPSEAEAAFWFFVIRLSIMNIHYFLLVLMIYISIHLDKNLPARMALILQTALTLTTFFLSILPQNKILLLHSGHLVHYGNIWLRETWQVAWSYHVYTAIEFICLCLFIISLKDLLKKVFLRQKINLRERQTLIFFWALVVPQILGALGGYQLMGVFNTYNLFPIVHSVMGVFTLYYIRNNRHVTLPQSKQWIFNNLQDPLLVISNKNELVEANPAALEQSGVSLTEHFGKDVREIFPQYRKTIERHLQKIPSKTRIKYESPQRKISYFDANIQPLTNPAGKKISTIILLRNITDKTLLEKQLLQERQLNKWIDRQFHEISLQLNLPEALQKTLPILFELAPFDAAEIYMQTEKTTKKLVSSMDISGINPSPIPAEGIPSAQTPPHMEDIRSHSFQLIHQKTTLGSLILYNHNLSEEYPASTLSKIDLFTARLAGLLANLLDIESKQSLAREKERKRFANDIHDSVTQTLHAARMTLQVINLSAEVLPLQLNNYIIRVEMLLDGAEQELRSLLYELKPAALASISLHEMLNSLINANRLRTTAIFSQHFHHIHEPSAEIKKTIYRIAQEALNNAIRHAHASNITITLEAKNYKGIVLSIQDDGQGMDQKMTVRVSHGLAIMRERAESIHASLEIHSAPGKGTSVRVSWPANTGAISA